MQTDGTGAARKMPAWCRGQPGSRWASTRITTATQRWRNSLEAIRSGCTHVQGTINGYANVAGNANLVSVIANLQLKMGYDLVSEEKLTGLTDLSHYVSELANLSPNMHQPFVGQSAFAHKGGTHVNAVLKNVDSYQHIDPEVIGNQTRVLVSELSGKDNITVKADEFGVEGLSREKEARGAPAYQGVGKYRFRLLRALRPVSI